MGWFGWLTPKKVERTSMNESMDPQVEDVFEEARDALETAGEEAFVELKASAEDVLPGSLRDPFDVPEAVPLGEDHNFRTAATALIDSSVKIFESQAAEAIRALTEIGVESTQRGTKVLTQMMDVSKLVANGRLSVDSAQNAMRNLTEALKLEGRRAENAAKVEAYQRSQAALATAKSVLFAGLQVALQMGAPAVSAYLNKLPPPPTA